MPLTAVIEPCTLHFKFDAGTSRGVLHEKITYLLKIRNTANNLQGIGEAGPLKGLSIDDHPDFHSWLYQTCDAISKYSAPNSLQEVNSMVGKIDPQAPAIRFALEVALLDLLNGGQQMIFPSEFTQGRATIPINGLIWMGTIDFMKQQIDHKLQQGYECLKMKIGALDFEQECMVLDYIRSQAPPDLVLRVDANGAFDHEEVTTKLTQLSRYNLHSIEQPLAPNQLDALSKLCRQSSVPIALDEELIGIQEYDLKKELLDVLRPQYIVLKPTLLGGISSTREWIDLAESMGIGWWITSALESNVGLNAIAQFTASMPYKGHQGLGTGQLFTNNVPGRLFIKKAQLHCRPW
ncbi:MAG: o-succinylbenzoate synthase [Cyclobacteriaceae bacterium]|nr:o-succinylbenzoate synthase [Cyclobacteriaceae bacterium]